VIKKEFVLHDNGLDILLDLNGTEYTEKNGYWYKIEAWRIEPTKERPHGIRYNLTFHNNYNKRILGFDNAHLPPNRKKGYKGRIIVFDHTHDHLLDKGTAYEFKNAEQLLKDFFERINEIMNEIQNR